MQSTYVSERAVTWGLTPYNRSSVPIRSCPRHAP